MTTAASQAAAMAVRHLQHQLKQAEAKVQELQEEKRQLRQDACQLAEAQHEALLQAKAHVDDLQSDKARVAGIVGELKAALEQSVQARDGLQLTVQSLEGLKAELTAARQAQDTAEQRAKAAEASVQALTGSGADCAAQLSASNQALEQAKAAAEGRASEVQHVQEVLHQMRQTHAEQKQLAQQLLQEKDAKIDGLQRDLAFSRARVDKAELRASVPSQLQRRLKELEGRAKQAQEAQECAECAVALQGRAAGSLLRAAAVLHAVADRHSQHAAKLAASVPEPDSSLQQDLRASAEAAAEVASQARRLCSSVERLQQGPRGQSPHRHRHAVTSDTYRTLFPFQQGPEAAARSPANRAHTLEGAMREARLAGILADSGGEASQEAASEVSSSEAPSSPREQAYSIPAHHGSRHASPRRHSSPRRHRAEKPGGPLSKAGGLLNKGESVQAVLVSLEDELGLLDQRFGELLATAQNPDCSSWPNPEAKREALSDMTAKVLDAMHQKGAQIRQLRQHCRQTA